MLTHRLQGIGIEETVSFERHATDKTVVERTLQHVVILRLAVEQEQTVVHIDIANRRTRLAIGTHIGQFIVLAKGLPARCCTDAACDIQFLPDNVVPDAVNSLDVALVTCQRCHVSHTGIHIRSTHCMTHCLVLIHHGLVTLRVVVLYRRLTAIVKQELRKVQISLLASSQVETRHGHLGYLVTRHHTHLPRIGPHFLACHVGIAAGNVKKLSLTRRLPIGHGTLYHVPQVVELMTQVLLLHPALLSCPVVWVRRVLRTGGIQVAVRLLGPANHVDH